MCSPIVPALFSPLPVRIPTQIFCVPVVFFNPDSKPINILLSAVDINPALLPKCILFVFASPEKPVLYPTFILLSPVILLYPL